MSLHAQGGASQSLRARWAAYPEHSRGIMSDVDAVVGIDIAKAKFDCAWLCQGKFKTRVFANTPEAHEELRAWLSALGGHPLLCMEATGSYHEALATHSHRHRLSGGGGQSAAREALRGSRAGARAKSRAARCPAHRPLCRHPSACALDAARPRGACAARARAPSGGAARPQGPRGQPPGGREPRRCAPPSRRCSGCLIPRSRPSVPRSATTWISILTSDTKSSCSRASRAWAREPLPYC
jgi:transposase